MTRRVAWLTRRSIGFVACLVGLALVQPAFAGELALSIEEAVRLAVVSGMMV